MDWAHQHIPGYSDLMQKLDSSDELLTTTVSPIREMAFEGAEELFFKLVDSVKPAIIQHPLRLAVSMGKDSSCLLAIFVEAYRQIILAGDKPKAPLIVTHANTRIESPVMDLYANRQLRLLELYLKKWQIPHEIHSAKPADRYSWPVLFIGGLKLITVGSSATADCSVELKLIPLKAIERKLTKIYGDNIVNVTGVRSSESAERKETLKSLGLDSGQIVKTNKNGQISLDYAPLANITTDEVWLILRCLGVGATRAYGKCLPYWDHSTWYLSKLYSDQSSADSCPIIGSGAMSNSRPGGCSSSLRSGCALCTTVNIDKQAEALSDLAQYPQLKNLLAIRNWLSHSFYDLKYRRFIGRKPNDDGYVKLEANTFNELWLEQVLRWTLQADADEIDRANAFKYNLQTKNWINDSGIQAILNEKIPGWQKSQWIKEYIQDMQEPTFQLVAPTQLLLIDAFWSRDNYAFKPFSALAIWNEVYNEGKRCDYPTIEGKKAVNTIPAPRYVYVGNDPELESLNDIEKSNVFSRYISELTTAEFSPDNCGTTLTARSHNTEAINYNGEEGKIFSAWFGEYQATPMVVPRQEEDDSGYVIDIEAAESITTFMINDYLKVYKNAEELIKKGLEYRANIALRRLINEGVLRLSPVALKNTSRLMARAKLYEEAGLISMSECNDDKILKNSISEAEYKKLSATGIQTSSSDTTVKISTIEQLNDIKSAAKSARAMYRKLCASRCAAMVTVNEMGSQFTFDGCQFQSLVVTQTKQMQEITNTLNNKKGILSLLPKIAPLRCTTLPSNVERLLNDFANQMHLEFIQVEKDCWQIILEKLNSNVSRIRDDMYVVFGAEKMIYIKNIEHAIAYVQHQIQIRKLKMAS